jgi:pyruvate dehydrogenase E2 component (dihydrolipoamide acetyltransferase)
MTITAVTMPRWGLTMEEGTVTGWLVSLGGHVSVGQELAEVESSKLAGTVEATAAGVLRRTIIEVGTTVPVGTLLGVIADASVDEAEIDAFVGTFKPVEVAAGEDESSKPKTVQAGGLRWSYLRSGEGGVPLVLIHGFGGDAAGWGFIQGAVAADQDVIAVDLPGHGNSEKTVPDGSIDAQAEAVIGFLDALGIDKAHLAGHSMGGGIAIGIALKAPGRVASLTLLAPVGLGDGINVDYLKGFVAARKRRDLEGVLRLLFANESLVTPALAEDIIRYKRLDGAQPALEGLLAALLNGQAQRAQYRDKLGAIAVPVTVIWGAQDRIIPPEHAAGLPASVRVETLAGSGHMPQVEAADQVTRILKETIAKA